MNPIVINLWKRKGKFYWGHGTEPLHPKSDSIKNIPVDEVKRMLTQAIQQERLQKDLELRHVQETADEQALELLKNINIKLLDDMSNSLDTLMELTESIVSHLQVDSVTHPAFVSLTHYEKEKKNWIELEKQFDELVKTVRNLTE